ncbi:MAG: hypothetical protein HYY76_00230 [Acidobacteria bacterium]|nr:hypothetical protein [Acidobacteriota bacterium]
MFRAGHAIRLAIAGADAGAFDVPLSISPLIDETHRASAHPSPRTRRFGIVVVHSFSGALQQLEAMMPPALAHPQTLLDRLRARTGI